MKNIHKKSKSNIVKAGRKPLPAGEKKVSHHFKLSPKTKAWIEKKSKKLGLTKTGYIEKLVADDNK